MRPTIRPATMADADALKLRPSDDLEVNLWVPGMGGAEVVRSTLQCATEAITAEVDGRVVALAGYTVDGQEVYPWLLCAEQARRHRVFMVRYARAMLAYIRDLYPQALICNHVHRPNAEARAFLQHLGFRILPTPGRAAEFDFFYLPPCA